MNIAWFGSSLVSAYWNGAATYYRGIIRALADRGHRITFYEPDAFDRQAHRDLADPEWASVVVYPATEAAVHMMLDRARSSDLLIKSSRIGVYDELLERAVLDLRSPRTLVAFWDVDAPATLDRVVRDVDDPFRTFIPRYDLVLTYGGGAPVTTAYEQLGARLCVPIYNALDPSTHYRIDPDPRFAASLAFLGNRLPDRERRVDKFFLEAATRIPEHACLLGGAGWDDKPVPHNVRYLGHVYTRDHNALNSTPLAVLNISRDSSATFGYSPATRVFEAAGAGACLITDAWVGLEQFLEPGSEVLVAHDGAEVADHVRTLTPTRARTIGGRAHRRVLSQHTYAHRALDVERALGQRNRTPRGQRTLSIAMLGLSITSSWGNGHATTYRGLVRELAAAGHRVTFLERDVSWYASNRDLGAAQLGPAPWARVALYASLDELRSRFVQEVRDADLVVVGSCVPDGIDVARWVLDTARGKTAFYDLDTPVTLAKLAANSCEYLERAQVPHFDLYLSFTGGPTLERIEDELGAKRAVPLYCAVDLGHYGPEIRATRWDLGYMGTYSADRQPGLRRLLLEPARRLPDRSMIVAGPQYPADIEWPANVERLDHVAPVDHSAFYNSSRFALNVTRPDMLEAGWSPSVRLFEAAACGVAIISDSWPGLDELFTPDHEILIARDTEDVVRYLRDIREQDRRAIGARAHARVRLAHTAAHRAADLERYARS